MTALDRRYEDALGLALLMLVLLETWRCLDLLFVDYEKDTSTTCFASAMAARVGEAEGP